MLLLFLFFEAGKTISQLTSNRTFYIKLNQWAADLKINFFVWLYFQRSLHLNQSTKLRVIVTQIVVALCWFKYESMEPRHRNISNTDMCFLASAKIDFYIFLHIYNVDYFARTRAKWFQHYILILNTESSRRYIVLDYAHEFIVCVTSDFTRISCLTQLAFQTLPIVYTDTCIYPTHFVLLEPLLKTVLVDILHATWTFTWRQQRILFILFFR